MTAPVEQMGGPRPVKRSPEYYCSASKSDGSPCHAYAIKGGSVCRTHGGSAPAVRDAARRRFEMRAVQADAAAVLATEGLEAVGDPVEALAELAARISATEKAMAARVNSLQSLSYPSNLGTEQIKAEMVIWGQFLDRLAKILETLGKFNLDERRVRISEGQGLLVAEVMRRIFGRLNLTPVQWGLAQVVAPEELRRLGE